MADTLYRVELSASFLERLDAIEAFLIDADAGFAYDKLLAELRATVVPNLRRFPRIGRRYLAHPPQSAEALAQLAALPAGAAHALREYLHGDFLMLHASVGAGAAVYLLSIRHHGQLSFDFARLWPGGPDAQPDAPRVKPLPARSKHADTSVGKNKVVNHHHEVPLRVLTRSRPLSHRKACQRTAPTTA